MGRYQNRRRRWEVSGGLKHNRWSGAYAAITARSETASAQWNSMFNVDWTKDLGRRRLPRLRGPVPPTGCWACATAGPVDRRHRHDPPGQGEHRQPDRGRAEQLGTWNTAQLTYEFAGDLRGLQVYGMGG